MSVIIILVEPQMGENIGAAGRAMKNFGLSEMRIVKPRDGWPNAAAESMAVGAVDIIHSAQIFSDLTAAIKDIEMLYASTAQLRDMHKPVTSCHNLKLGSAKTGIMFGRENNGLNNEEISYADAILQIKTIADFSSLNIAHAVAVICHQLYAKAESHNVTQDLASKGDLEYFLQNLEDQLEASSFYKVAEKQPLMRRNMRNIFTRNQLSKTELQTLHGVIAALTRQGS